LKKKMMITEIVIRESREKREKLNREN
jgi:hypothetical protein